MTERYVRMNILSSGGEKAKATLDDLAMRARKLEAESPDLKINADDSDAVKKLKDLKLKLTILDREQHEIGVGVKDDDAKAKLLDFKIKIDELKNTVADPEIKIKDYDKVEAQLLKLHVLMDSFHNKNIDLKVSEDAKKAIAEEGILAKLARSANKGILGIPRGEGGGGDGENALAGLLNGSPGAFLAQPAVLGPLGSLLASLLPGIAGLGVGGLVGVGGAGLSYLGASTSASNVKADAGIIAELEKDLKQKGQSPASIALEKSNLASALKQQTSDQNINVPFVKLLGDAKQLLQPLVGIIRPFTAALDPLIVQLGKFEVMIGPSLSKMFMASLPFVKSFLQFMEQGGKALIPAFTYAMNEMVKSGALKEMTLALVELITDGLVPMLKIMGPGMKASAEVFRAVVLTLDGILVGLGALAMFIAKELMMLGHAVIDVGKVFFDIGRVIAALLGGNWKAMGNAVDALGNNFRNFFATLANMLDLGAVKISHFAHNVASTFDDLRHDISSIWDTMWDNVIGRTENGVHDDQNMMSNFRHNTANIFDGLRHDVSNIWDLMWHDLESKEYAVFDVIRNNVRNNWGFVVDEFHRGVADVRSAFDMLKSDLADPWNWIVAHVFHPIEHIWNDIAGVVGLHKIPGFAAGGRIGVGTTGTADDVLIRASKGETVVSAQHSQALAPIFSAVGIPGYAAGGIVGGIGGILHGAESVGGKILNIGKDIMDIVTNPLKIFSALENKGAEGIFAPIVEAAIKGIVSSLKSAGNSMMGGKYTGHYGAGVAQWRPDVLRALSMLGEPAGLAGNVLYQMQTESGGNPNAINLTDSNAAAGDPSRGLMQTIMTTFEAYRSHQLPNDIYNPLANIYAAINYAIHRYGRSLMSGGMGIGSGHGYAHGGWITEPIVGTGLRSGQAYTFGELGPEYVTPGNRMHGGGDTYYISVAGDTDPDAAALRIIQKVRDYKRHRGNQPTGIG